MLFALKTSTVYVVLGNGLSIMMTSTLLRFVSPEAYDIELCSIFPDASTTTMSRSLMSGRLDPLESGY